ncbi:MAG: hypothetical protein V8T10_08560 [Merdibacter sp.]
MNAERKPSGFLKQLFLNIPSVIEYVIAAALIFAMVISMIIFIIREMSGIFSGNLCSGALSEFCALPGGRRGVRADADLEDAGLDYVEVVMFAIARQIIISHDSALDNLIGALAVVLMFCCRKYLLKDDNRTLGEE